MAHQPLPNDDAVLTLAFRCLVLALAMANTGVVAAIGSEFTGSTRRYNIATSCVSAAALFVDGHVIVALVNRSRKIPRPHTVFTAVLDVLMGVTLAVFAKKLDDEAPKSSPDSVSSTVEDIIPASVALTAIHAALRLLCVVWICGAPFITFEFHRRRSAIPPPKHPEEYEFELDAQRPWPSELAGGQQRSELPTTHPRTELEAGYGRSEMLASSPVAELPAATRGY